MSLLTRTITTSYLRVHASKVLDELARTREPIVIIKNGIPRAVIEDIVAYEERQDTLKLLRLHAAGAAISTREVAVSKESGS